ncbi:hypothetical protein GN244_ATG02688 [Phytophthora infestans]|nr:hypothetical protein GN244_ATG02688 [Phytophthora infestans]
MALMSPKLGALKDYIKAFNREKSADESLLKVMTNGFGGEREYAKFLVKAQLEVVPGSAARSFQTALFNQWLQRNIDPEMLLKNLRLDRGMEDVLADTNLVTLSTYIPVYNARNPNRKTSLIGTLSAHYGDKEVVNALYINRDDSRIDSLVVNLQRKQLAWWLENEKSADDVFSLLKIESDDFSPTKGQTLAALGEFVALLNAINPQHQTNVFAVLQNRFGGDGQLARVVIKALDTADSESVHSSASAALRYRKALFSRWFDNNIKPKDIYLKVLKVKRLLLTRWKNRL